MAVGRPVNHTEVCRGWEIYLGVPPPLGAGRGPDAIILAGRYLLFLACVVASRPSQAHLDRLLAMARDLRRFHPSARSLSAGRVLVLTESDMRPVLHDGVCVGSPSKLYGLFRMLGLENTRPAPDPAAWLSETPAAPARARRALGPAACFASPRSTRMPAMPKTAARRRC